MDQDEGRRGDERVTINEEFESLDAFFETYVSNISRTGAFIKSPAPLPLGTRLQLRFVVLSQELEAIEAVAEVVRVQNDPPGMGVVFTELSEASARLIEKLLARRAGRG